MISEEVTLKILRFFPKNAIRGMVLEFIFYFKGIVNVGIEGMYREVGVNTI